MNKPQLLIAAAVISGLVVVLIAPVAQAADKTAAETTAGDRPIQNFRLRDAHGKDFSLDDFKARKFVVIAMLGTECPLAMLYAPRLEEISERFAAQGIGLIGINSNQQDSISELAAFVKIHGIKFPVLKDVGNVVADQLGAERTPEVFVLDQDRRIAYRGRIDDQYVVGRQRPKATRDDLVVALDELLSGRKVSEPVTSVQGCRIGRVHTPQGEALVTYTKQVAPILNQHCVECHRAGEIGPFSLTNYAEVVGWADTIGEVIDDNRMPPWHANPKYGHFSNDRRLSDEQKQVIHDWIAAGTPQGNPKDLPTPPTFAEGWRLPRLDQEIFMSDHEFNVPAEGTVDYKHFVVDPGFTKDMWVQAAECKPGNRAIVHHIIVYARPPAGRHRHVPATIGRGLLAATAPGARPLLLPEGTAKLVPAGSKLIFQMHYTPNGKAQKDRSSIGLMFTPADQVQKEVNTVSIDNMMLLIPPRVPDYKTEVWFTFHRDTQLLSLYPHMHLRGKSFSYEATYPDGRKEILLDVPHYDFAWQASYEFSEPKHMPKGTRMHCVAHFDNSVENVANPNPNRIVTWGDQTWDEMMIGFMDTVTDDSTNEIPQQPGPDDKLSKRRRGASR
ncbi:MAG TPA: redoxin domain-containing protein [Pirellulales bacterium]|nr:redoxin domain-containing protein [Pirellulales bacterium]